MDIPNSRVKACTECRQQKLRCDAAQHPKTAGCTRCRKKQLQCVISGRFTREKRKTKSELLAELEALKSSANGGTSHASRSSSSRPATPRNVMTSYLTPPEVHIPHRDQDAEPFVSKAVVAPFIAPGASPFSPAPPQFRPQVLQGATMSAGTFSAETSELPSFTIERTLEDISVNSKALDDCFTEFFTHYSFQTPVVETRVTPNTCFTQSPFLFWTIVCIGSRKYTGDPTLLTQLAPAVVKLVKDAAFAARNEKSLYTIQALVLLCAWPIPHASTSEDMAPMISGILLQQALLVGLHIFGVGQDFFRMKLSKDRSHMDFRARLWASCIVACQRVALTQGVPPVLIPDNYDHEYTQAHAMHALSPTLRYRKTLCHVLTETILQLERFALSKAADRRAATINPIIDAAIVSITHVKTECSTDIDRFYSNCAELQLLSFHLLAPKETFEQLKLEKMYNLACAAIEVVNELDKREGIAKYAGQAVQKYLSLASLTILKLSRSHVREQVDLERGKSAYFAVIEMCRDFSLESGDVMARFRTKLTQLWTSKKIFKKPDGTIDALSLRCGSRLAMCISYDMLWWWRAEFGGESGTYEDSGAAQEEDVAIVSEQLSPESLTTLNGWQESFPEFLWPTTDDMLSMDWGSIATAPGYTSGDTTSGSVNPDMWT